MRHAIIAVLLLAALAGTAVAGPYEDGVSAYQRGDYAEAAQNGTKVGQVTKVRLSDRIRRLELIGKHVNVQAFAERKEIGGIGGGPIEVNDLSLTEVARRIAFVLAKASQD